MMFHDVAGQYDKWTSPEAAVVASALSKPAPAKSARAAVPPVKEKGSALPALLGLGALFAIVAAIDLYGQQLKQR